MPARRPRVRLIAREGPSASRDAPRRRLAARPNAREPLDVRAPHQARARRRSRGRQGGSGRAARDAQQHLEAGAPKVSQPMSDATSYAYVVELAEDGSYWAYLPDLP